MGSLAKVKALFGFTSPRSVKKIIPEINLLCEQFSGMRWSGKQGVQADYFKTLFNADFYHGDKFPKNPRFAARDRITRAPKAFGFVNLKPSIELTEAGKLLLSGKRSDETFTRQLIKFQLPSPYHTQSKKIEFGVKPYLELIRLVRDTGSLSKTEIALFFLQLTHINKYDKIITKILQFRKGSKEYKGSRKTYVFEIFEKEIADIFQEIILENKFKTRQSSDQSYKKFINTKRSNMLDYADAFVRHIRATELITFERRTYRLVISPQKKDEVEYLLSKIPREPQIFNKKTELTEFKNYLFNPFSIKLLSDNKNLLIKKIQNLGLTEFDKSLELESLKDILDNLEDTVKTINIENNKKELKNYKELPDIINVFEQIKKKNVPDPPLFLEWNVWRSFEMLNYAKRINPNFVMDIDGMPLNTAPGNKADLEIEFDDFAIIGEVTLSSGATQFKMEGDSVPRHYGDFKERIGKESYCIFIAPKVDYGTKAFFFNLNKGFTKRYGGATKIIPLTLDKFIEFLNVGVANNFSDPSKLKNWLEKQWLSNQTIDNEEVWNTEIEASLAGWTS